MNDGKMKHGSVTGPLDDEITGALTSAAIVDTSSVGKLYVTGADRLDLLHRLSTNDLVGLRPSSAVGTVFTTDKGRIVDYVNVLVFSDSLLLITSPGQETRLKAWIDKYTIMEDFQLSIVTPIWSMYSLIGPDVFVKASDIFGRPSESGKVIDWQVADTSIKLHYCEEFDRDCLNILVPREKAKKVWSILLEKGEVAGIKVLSSVGYEAVRIFQGIPGEGHELTDEFNPYEAGLAHAISFTKGCYIGQEVIARLDTYEKVQRKLVRMKFKDIPDYPHEKVLLTKGGESVGWLTSFSSTSVNGEYVGLGIVSKGKVSKGDTLIMRNQHMETSGVVTEQFERSRS